MTDITINEAQKKVDEWINTTGVRYFNELTNLILRCTAAEPNTTHKGLKNWTNKRKG